MTRNITLGDDDGYFVVDFPGGSVQLDLYHAHDRLAEIVNTNTTSSEACHVALAEQMATWGLPRMSQRQATLFCRQVFDAVAEIKKKDNLVGGEATPNSPVSTAPVLSD